MFTDLPKDFWGRKLKCLPIQKYHCRDLERCISVHELLSILGKISQDALCQGRCCRMDNRAKDPGIERRMKAGSIRTTSLLKHNDITDNTLLHCELILHLHRAVLQYFCASIFIFQQVIFGWSGSWTTKIPVMANFIYYLLSILDAKMSYQL